MSDQVEEIKQKTDIVSLISEYLELKKAGRNYKAICPFHSEKTPSFVVSPELQMYKCFGCGEGGDVYTFLQKYEGMDFPEALRFLADKAQIKLISIRPEAAGEKEKLFQINSLAARFYNYLLLSHPIGKRALYYLEKQRGLSKDSIKRFLLGFSPEVPGSLVKFLVDKKKFQVKDLEKAGLLLFDSGRAVERFRGRIMFPIFDHRGNVVGFSGRILPSERSENLAKYINTPETPVFHKSNLLYGLSLTKEDIKGKKEAILVEGQMDVVSSWEKGITNIVAIGGSALTEEQVRLVSRFAERVVFALDTDFAGNSAARRGVVLAQEADLEVYLANFP